MQTFRFGLGAALAALALIASPAGAQRFGERTDVLAIEVPVQVVTKDGVPVRGLTAADFEVTQGRTRLPVVGFEAVDLGSPGASAAPAPAAAMPAAVPVAARRHLLLLFDLSNSEPSSIVKARQAARETVLSRLHPTDLVGVATFSNANGPQLALGFTSDRRQVERAIDSLGLPQLVDRNADPLRLIAADLKEHPAPQAGAGGGAGGGMRAAMDEIMRELLENDARVSERATAVVRRNQLTAFARSMSEFSARLAAIPARKQVVYLSEGFDSSILLGTTDQARQNEMSTAAMSGEIWKVDSDERFGSTEATNVLEKLFESMRRADCVIQSVDIGGLRTAGSLAPERPAGQDGLFVLAHETGGEMVRNFNDLGEALGRVLTRTAVTYVLTVQPEVGKKDGAFRKLKVELKGTAAQGAVVSARAGYYAPRPNPGEAPMERLLATASALYDDKRAAAFPLAVWAAPFRLPATPAAYVPVLIEVDGPGLTAKAASGTLPAEIYAYAVAADGEVRDFFSQTVGLDLAKVGGALSASGLKFFGHLDLPPGQYTLRTLVRNGTDGRATLAVRPLSIPAAAEPDLLPVLFPETPGSWVMVREVPRGAAKDVPYPFQVEQQPFIPAGAPRLEGGKELPAVVFAYHLPAGEVKPAAAVLGRDGKPAGAAEIRLAAREAGGAEGPDRFKATVKLPALPPGDYQLELSLTDAAGASRSSRAPFRVGGRG